jgi:hypothetical protein
MTADNFPTPLGFPQGSNPYNIIAGLAGPSGGVMYYASTVNTLATTYPFRETTGNAYRITQYVDAKTALGTYTYTFTATGNNINITRTIIVVVRENTPELTPIINYNSEELKPNSDGSYTIIKPLGSNVLTTNIAAKISYYESPLASFTSSGTGVTTLYNVDGLRYLLDTRITYSGPLASITPLVTKIAVQMGAANNNKVDDAATSQTNPAVNYDLYNATGAVREIDLIALRDETTYTTSTNIFDPLKTITSTTFPGIHTFTVQIGALSRTFIFRVVEANPMILVKDDGVKYGPSGAEIVGNVTLNKDDGKYYVDGVGQFIKIDVLPFGMASGSYPYTYIRRTPSGSLLSNTNNVSLLLKPTGSFATYDGTLAFPIAPNPGYEMVVNELLSEEGEYLYSFTINNVLREIKIVVLAAPELRVETVSVNNVPLSNANDVFYINHSTFSRYLEVTLAEYNVENTYKYILNKTGLFPTGANLTSALQDLVIIDGKMTVGITLPALTAGNEAIPETHTYMIALYKGNVQIGVVTKIVIFSEPNNSTVFFNTNGGTAIEPVTQYVGTKTPTLTTTRAGYSFDSWHLTTALNDATPRTLGSGGNFVLAAADTILYAKWTALEYTVTLNPGGGTTGNGTATVNATSGLSMPTAVRPQTGPSGLTVFQGFFSAASGAGTKYYNADMSSARNWDIHEEDLTVTLFAHWTAN